jgi:hypothetical protein
MHRRDRAWAGAITFVSHGAVIGVRSTDPAVLERVAANPPTGARPCDEAATDAVYSWRVERSRSAPPVHVVSMRGRRDARPLRVARTAAIDEALALLVHDAEFRVAMYAPRDVFIHAAAVAWRGRAILVPGSSFAGKSTLAAQLVRHGAPYYSDEFAVLDGDGCVRPFPRRLTLRGGRGGPADRPTPESLGGTRGAEPLPVGAVVVTRHVPGARWEPESMTRGEIVLALLGHCVDVRARPAQVLERVVRSIGGDVVGLRGERGEAEPAARDVLRRLTPDSPPGAPG